MENWRISWRQSATMHMCVSWRAHAGQHPSSTETLHPLDSRSYSWNFSWSDLVELPARKLRAVSCVITHTCETALAGGSKPG